MSDPGTYRPVFGDICVRFGDIREGGSLVPSTTALSRPGAGPWPPVLAPGSRSVFHPPSTRKNLTKKFRETKGNDQKK